MPAAPGRQEPAGPEGQGARGVPLDEEDPCQRRYVEAREGGLGPSPGSRVGAGVVGRGRGVGGLGRGAPSWL